MPWMFPIITQIAGSSSSKSIMKMLDKTGLWGNTTSSINIVAILSWKHLTMCSSHKPKFCSPKDISIQETSLPGLLAVGEKEVRQPRAAVSQQVLSSRRHCPLEEVIAFWSIKQTTQGRVTFYQGTQADVCLVLIQFYTKIKLEKVWKPNPAASCSTW